MRKLLCILMVVLMMMGAFAGCSDKKTAGDAGTDQTPQNQSENGDDKGNTGNGVKYKDTIKLATAVDQNYMDGQMNNTNDKVLRTVYSSLVRRDSNNEIVGDLAESWEVSDDNLTWTFHLRKDVKWHDGTPFTAADVKASYDRLLNQDDPVRYTSTMGLIKGCNIVDDHTIELYTEKPTPMMLAMIGHRGNLILSKHYIEKYGKDLGLTAESCNGTGPYVLKEWDMGERMVFESFSDYFEGEAPTKNLIIEIMPEAASRAIALETGEVDIADGVGSEDVLRLKDVDGIAVNFYNSSGLHGFQFNCANEYLKDTRLRQAVSYAIDRESMVEALYSPIGEYCATSPLSEVVWGYHNFGVIKQDQEKAKKLMAEAGYPDGFEFSIMVVESYNKALPSAEMMVSDLDKVGIKATIDVVDSATFKGSMANRTYPGEDFPWGMFIMGYGPGTLDADEGLRRIWYTSEKGDNNNNYGWYSNTEADKLLLAAAYEMDSDVRKEMYKDSMQILYIDDPAAVFTNQRKLIYCMSDNVEGFLVDVRNAINYTSLKCKE